MKLKNIRTIDLVEDGLEKTRLVCDVEDCSFSPSSQLYFVVPREIKSWLSDDVYDGFMVAMLFPIMRYNEPLEIDGLVSKKVYLNLMYEVSSSLRDFDNTLSLPDIRVKGYADAKKNKDLHTGVGFAAGVDSFATLHDHYWNPRDKDRKIDTLFFLHADQYDDPLSPESKWRAYENYKSLTLRFAEKIGMQSIYMTSNMFEFHPAYGTIRSNGFLARVSMVLALQRALKCFYFSADLSYGQMLEVVDMFKYQPIVHRYYSYASLMYVCPMLSPNGLDLLPDGARYTRGDKIELIVNDPYVKEFLNVCCHDGTNGKNCTECRKCLTTMLALEIMGRLDDFKEVFDVYYFRKKMYKVKCHVVYYNTKEEYSMIDVQLAKKYNYPLPSKFTASLYLLTRNIYFKLGINRLKGLFVKK